MGSEKCASESLQQVTKSLQECPQGVQKNCNQFITSKPACEPKPSQGHVSRAMKPVGIENRRPFGVDHDTHQSDRRRKRGGEDPPHWLFAESTTTPGSTLARNNVRIDAPSCNNIRSFEHLLHVIHKHPSHTRLSCCAW